MQRVAFTIVLGLVSSLLCAAADNPSAPEVSCGNGVPGGIHCTASKKELKEAHDAFVRGLRFQDHKQPEDAFVQFDQAARLVPQDAQFLTAREVVKAELVFNHVQRGNVFLLEQSRPQAAAEFRAALELDSDNQFARERLDEATRELPPVNANSRLEDTGEIHIQPRGDRATFHFRGDTRGLFTQLAAAYGVTVQFDDSLQSHQIEFNVDDVDFFTAVKLACQTTKTMWSALDAHQLLIAADDVNSHKQFDRMSFRAFLLPPHSTPQESTEIVTTLRTMFDLRFVTAVLGGDRVEIRAPSPVLKACGELLDQLSNARPQIMLDVRVYQIDHQLTRNIGLHVPNTFNLTNIPVAALAGLGGQNIQDLINQLIASGGINQAGSTGLAGLLAQLGGQGNNIFSTPQATFGGGLTFMGLSLDQLVTNLSLNESWVRSLENLTMRANQSTDATFHLGERYPILNASYAPVFNSPAISQVLGNQTYVPPFPSVSYEDLGLNVKARPTVHGDGTISLVIELQVRSLTGQSANGVPVISNREYKGSINLKEGEPAVVAGEISSSDTLSMSGIPGLFLPVLNNTALDNNKQVETDELMIVMTPHILSDFKRATPEISVSER
jgi:general secretion pathway protein D